MIVPTFAQLSIVATKQQTTLPKNKMIDQIFTREEKTNVWDLGILLPPLCLPLEAEVWKIFSSSKICTLCIAAT